MASTSAVRCQLTASGAWCTCSTWASGARSCKSCPRLLVTIDVRGTQVRELPERVWRIKALRHVLGDGLAYPTTSTGGDLKLMQTLETVAIKEAVNKSTKRVVLGLGSLQRLHVVGLNRSQEQALETILHDLSSLNSLSLQSGGVIPINLLACPGSSASASCLGHVVSLELHGRLLPLPRVPSNVNLLYCFSCSPTPSPTNGHYVFSRLARLVPRSTKIKQDFIDVISSKLPVLSELSLQEDSYLDEELDLCTCRFRSLKVLQVSGRLEQLNKIIVPGVTPGSDKKRFQPTVMDHVVVETHKSCHYCKLEAAAQHQAPSASPSTNNNPQKQNGGQQDGQATDGDDAHQHPPPPYQEIIVKAINSNGESEKKDINAYIKKTYGDILEKHLAHMVQSGDLLVTSDTPKSKKKKYILPAKAMNGGHQDGQATNGHTKFPEEDVHQLDVQEVNVSTSQAKPKPQEEGEAPDGSRGEAEASSSWPPPLCSQWPTPPRLLPSLWPCCSPSSSRLPAWLPLPFLAVDADAAAAATLLMAVGVLLPLLAVATVQLPLPFLTATLLPFSSWPPPRFSPSRSPPRHRRLGELTLGRLGGDLAREPAGAQRATMGAGHE
ncbi:hypothetical protein BS78_K297600 [Paspalum vaginatum]|uniref:H15 domain-containing protein n=1 Tax=Paspalum vaginatum TaxID=158149 RepID=A0A9W7XAJ2_9POAL|nr:hypothetical protein BS78_K297600 [Paspalum vaginatum]